MTSAGTKQLRVQSRPGLADECVSGPCQPWREPPFNIFLK